MIGKNTNNSSINTLLNELEKNVVNFNKINKLFESQQIKINSFIDENSKTTLLHRMIQKNKTLSAKWLLENHANPYIEDNHSNPAFFYFINATNTNDMFNLLIKNNIDFNFKNSHGRTVLQDIVLNGDLTLFKKVLPKIKNPFSEDNYKKNILFDALSSGNKELIETICNIKESNLQIQNENGESLLHYVKDGRLETLEFLLHIGVSPALQDLHGKNIIYYLSERAEKSTNEDELQQITNIIDLALQYKEVIDQKNKDGDNLLTNFLKNLHKPLGAYNQKQFLAKLINKFIDSGVDINESDENGDTALIISIEKNDIDTAKILLEKGANVNIQNSKGYTPLSIASLKADKSYFDTIQLLLAFEASPDIKDSKNMTLIEKILYILIYSTNYENATLPFSFSDISFDSEKEDELSKFGKDDYLKSVLELILGQGTANLNMLDSQGNPYFFILIITANDTFAKLLFRYGANVNQTNFEDKNILQYYLEVYGQNQTDKVAFNKRIKEIIKLGVNLDYRDENGGTVLHSTVIKHPLDVTKNIYNCGAGIDVIDNKGRTLLHNAIWGNKLETIKFILNNKKELINTPDKMGILPINYAAFMGNKELVCYLIKEKSYVNNTYEKPKHILDFLKRFHKNIIKLENIKNVSAEEKRDISILLSNMRREFSIIE